MKTPVMKRSLVAFMACVAVMPAGVWAEPMDGGKAFTKLMRGAVNLSTGWVEIPKRIYETSETSGLFAGFTWGLLRGFGYGFTRTAGGGYELLTFPFPAPPGYESVIQPEYVFTTAEPSMYRRTR